MLWLRVLAGWTPEKGQIRNGCCQAHKPGDLKRIFSKTPCRKCKGLEGRSIADSVQAFRHMEEAEKQMRCQKILRKVVPGAGQGAGRCHST